MKYIHLVLTALIGSLTVVPALAQDRPASAAASSGDARAQDCPKPLAQRHFHGAERNYPISLSRPDAPCDPEHAKQAPKKPLHDHRQVHK